jgi:hypothetical protein
MQKSLFILVLIVFAFAACKKNKAEDPPPIDKQQLPFTLEGTWRIKTATGWGYDAFYFYNAAPDSLYRRNKLGTIEQGVFHTRVFSNPDSMEVYLKKDTILIIKLENTKIKVIEKDSTSVFHRVIMPG